MHNGVTMKKFKDHKSIKTIRRQCKAQGLRLDMSDYDLGADFIFVEGGGCRVQYDVTTGCFFGRTPDGIRFNSSSTEHEKHWWFNALLSFFMIEDGPPWIVTDGVNMPADLYDKTIDIRTREMGEDYGLLVGDGGDPRWEMAEPAFWDHLVPTVYDIMAYRVRKP